jgi:carbon storage regulator
VAATEAGYTDRMLVFTRKAGEAVRIGDDIELSVVEIGASTIRLGIDAPRAVRIIRSELSPARDGGKDGVTTP